MHNNNHEQSPQELRKRRSEVLKAEAKAKFEGVKFWVEDNKELLMVLVPSAVTILAYERKHRIAKKTRYNKERYVYDARLGHYWELRRKPSSSDWVKIEARRRGGESLGSVLSSMNLLR